jgi:ACS family D-galactonate transporter-like MFS transporter
MSTNKPTSVRWSIFIVLLILCTINYIDRAVLSVSMPSIQKDLSLDPALVGFVLSAFFWGYAPMQIPAGWLADRFRTDRLLIGSAMFWGLLQIITGFLSSGRAFMFIRALLGVAESPMYPSATKLQSVWLTSKERGRGAAVFDSGAAMGAALGGPIVVLFVAWFGGWRGALIGAGILTILISAACYRFIQGTPDTNPRVNQAERDYLKKALTEEYESQSAGGGVKATAKDYLTSANFWLMCAGYYCIGSFWFGIMTWGPSYLSSALHLDIKSIGGAIFIIYGVGVVVEICGGWFIDKWRERGADINTAMRTLLVIFGVGMAGGMYMVTRSTSVVEALVWLTIAVSFERVAGCLYWSVPPAISQRKDVGTIAGCMNLAGNIAGALTPIIIGFIVSSTGSFDLAMLLFVTFGLGVSVASVFINYGRKIGGAPSATIHVSHGVAA